MIRVEFDVTKIPGSLLLTDADLKDASGLASALRDAADPFSLYLRGQLSRNTQESLAAYVSDEPLSAQFQQDLIADLNRQLQGPSLFEKKRFAGLQIQRDTLIKLLLEQEMKDPVRLNRLLLEEAYPQYIDESLKAEWDSWQSLAEDATAKVIIEWEAWKEQVLEKWQQTKVGNPPEFHPAWQPDIWKGIRAWLSAYVFHHKCAYCETGDAGHIPDAEHFRPKGQVRTKSGIVKTFHIDGATEITHPGYFWLAYRWENLLPSCNTCNRYSGKKDLFPVGKTHVGVRLITDPGELRHPKRKSTHINGIFYLEPDDLDQIEDRLLLHPYFDSPHEHVYFQLDGRAVPRPGSKQGQPSIDVFDLNQRDKVAQRSRIQSDDALNYVTKVSAAIPDKAAMKSVAERIAHEYFQGERPYAAAVFDTIRVFTGDDGLLSPDVLLKDTPYARVNLESD